MPNPEENPGGPRNIIAGTGNIVTGGKFINSQVVAETVSGPPNSLVRQLRDELTRARECLAAVEVPTADHEDAMKAIDALQGQVARDPDPDQRGLGRLRLRIKQLIGVLTPVAEVIGGVAAFEEIWRHL